MANSQNFFVCFVGDQPEDYCLEDDDCSSGELLEKHFYQSKKCVLLVTPRIQEPRTLKTVISKKKVEAKKTELLIE